MMTATRGGVEFDADILRKYVSQLAWHTPADPRHLAIYRRFYGIDFPEIPHSHQLFCMPVGEERIVVQHFVPERIAGHVFLCHGYYDHVGLYGHAIAYFLHRGLVVVTYDHIGHGLSSGEPATIDSFDRYVETTRFVWTHADQTYPQRWTWHWFGQSMGGAVVMEYLEQYPLDANHPVGEIVLLAPLVRPYAWWINRWVFAVAKHTITERPRVITENAENPEFLALQAIDPLQARTLPVAWVQAMVNWNKRFVAYPASELAPKLLQGDADRTVDWKYNIYMYERRYPQAHHFIIPGGRHHLANESRDIRARMWRFLDEHCEWGL
jgi:alpha-beta hydrolase superfamily lysophospholipase